ncbi:MAG: hypothetical protein WA957_12385 [Alteraurantiacibacter sp.]
MIGTPMMLALTLALRLLIGNAVMFEAIFWIGLATCIGIFALRPVLTKTGPR